MLQDPDRNLGWHYTEWAMATGFGRWFPAAHHIAYLYRMSHPGDDLPSMRVNYLRACTLRYCTDAKALETAASARQTNGTEQAFADVYMLLDVPPHKVPWWLGHDAHVAILRNIRDAETKHLLQRPPP